MIAEQLDLFAQLKELLPPEILQVDDKYFNLDVVNQIMKEAD